jgi:hypothetical protein
MAIIDLTTDLGRLRMRLGDYLDYPLQLPDSVYLQTLIDTQNIDGSTNLRRATIICGQYILAGLAFGSQGKMGLIESFGNQIFQQYKVFLNALIKDPSYSDVAPIPYSGSTATVNPLMQFTADWNANYVRGTQSDLLAQQATYQTI